MIHHILVIRHKILGATILAHNGEKLCLSLEITTNQKSDVHLWGLELCDI